MLPPSMDYKGSTDPPTRRPQWLRLQAHVEDDKYSIRILLAEVMYRTNSAAIRFEKC